MTARPTLGGMKRTGAGQRGTEEAKKSAEREAQAAKAEQPRKRMTFDIPADVARELRVAAVLLPPDVIGGTLSALVTRFLAEGLERLRKSHNHGQPFERPGEVRLRPGPPAQD